MSWQEELSEEFDKWDRILAVLERSERRSERATELRDAWLASIVTLRQIYDRARLTTAKPALAPLNSFINPPSFSTSVLGVDQSFPDATGTDRYIERLLLVRAQIQHVLVSPEPARAQRVEAALLHLQRLLAADGDLRAKWMKAWSTAHEPALEALGAVHLLHHRIYGFKATSPGASSDLILGTASSSAHSGEQPARTAADLGSGRNISADDALRAGTPLVLTEWKKVTNNSDAAEKLKQARVQLERYPVTAAAAIELRRTRFAILVSENELSELGTSETLGDGSEMRIVNITIEPARISVQAKKA